MGPVRRLAAFVALSLLLLAAGAQRAQPSDSKRAKTVKKQLKHEPEDEVPVVELSVGRLAGRWMQSAAGRRVAAFTAVPYAKSPIGDLRFKAPVAAEPWTGTRDSPPLEQVPVCMQPEDALTTQGFLRSEDCLLLNVFTPHPANGSDLPVLVWLHGGAFQEGGSPLYGPEHLLDRDLVLVALNYRLGALGFLSTGDAAAPGNWGLKDQQLALRWVRDHVRGLGGDPERVTLVGHSAGAISVHTHLMARSNSGLFQRAVSLGGSALSVGLPLSGAAARRTALRLATRVGCPASAPSAQLLSCLRAKPASELVEHVELVDGGLGLCPIVTWGPVVEDFVEDADKGRGAEEPPLLEMHPVDALSSGLALEVPWLAGLNLNDGGLWAARIQASKLMEVFDANLNHAAPLCFGFNDTAAPAELPAIMEEIRDFYFGANNITRENLNDLSNMFTDGVVLWSLDEAMRLHAAYSPAPAFLYLYSHRGQRSLTDLFHEAAGGRGGRGGPADLGVVHGDELLPLFPMSHLLPAAPARDPADRRASEQLIDLLLNFAQTGHPTPAGDTRYPVPWRPVESDDLEFVEIAQGGRLLRGAGLLGHRAHFWAALPLSERNVNNMQASMPESGRHDEL